MRLPSNSTVNPDARLCSLFVAWLRAPEGLEFDNFHGPFKASQHSCSWRSWRSAQECLSGPRSAVCWQGMKIYLPQVHGFELSIVLHIFRVRSQLKRLVLVVWHYATLVQTALAFLGSMTDTRDLSSYEVFYKWCRKDITFQRVIERFRSSDFWIPFEPRHDPGRIDQSHTQVAYCVEQIPF